MSSAPPFQTAKRIYDALWNEMVTKPDKVAAADAIVRKIVAGKARYQAVESATAVPWFAIALIHNMEAGLNFKCHLHNGDPLTARTTHVPKGRPVAGNPPFTWEESATDALQFDGLAHQGDWSVAHLAYRLEGFNGWGYWHYHPEVKTPYLWSFSNLYTKGKYTADGKWSATAVSDQCGAMVVLRRLIDKDASVKDALAQGNALATATGVAAPVTIPPATIAAGTAPPWMNVAHGEIGQRDYPGPKYNPRVVEYLSTTNEAANDDETSWCSAFVNWCMIQSGLPGTGKADARSWLGYGETLGPPKPGCIVVLWRESPQSWKGHVGFFDGWDTGGRVRLLGGNQGGGTDWDEVCVTTFPKERILGFRWPTGVS
jgi:uncharacterized protein (TIGR02594 family)